ncbi:MAG: right-handed parallel beta-helix repeat-containing protein [Paenibacillaceae bacterium]|nr:right-handed parallel beta-helix repeat-containing protein [Paenibacillaceae bacterium]
MKSFFSAAMTVLLFVSTVAVAIFVPQGEADAASYSFVATDDLYTKNGTVVTNDDSNLHVRESKDAKVTYLKFTVSGVVGAVNSAILRLKVTNPGDAHLRVYAGTSNVWSESNTASLPAAGALIASDDANYAHNDTVAIDVGSYINNNGTYTLIIKGANGVSDLAFKSSEAASDQPTLAIQTFGTADVSPPAAVADLGNVTPAAKSFYVNLNWTAPGDDDTLGTAAAYDLRYSTSPLTPANWGSATDVPFEPAPAAAGATQQLTVSGLTPSTTYYFALRTTDDAGNVSGLSNVVTATTAAPTCDVVVEPITAAAPSNIYDATAVPGGSVICLRNGDWVSLRLMNVNASPGANADAPIQVINYQDETGDGLVNLVSTDRDYGIKIENSRFLQLTGTGSDNYEYGIQISAQKAKALGLQVKSLSTNYEIDHLFLHDMTNSSQGMLLKNDPVCDVSDLGHWTQYNTTVHDNKFDHIGMEAVYLGDSFYSNGEPNTSCHGGKVKPNPLEGVRLYNNIVNYTGWDGLQVGSATKDVEIHHNTITQFSKANYHFERSGIQINPGTTGKLYNNWIQDGLGAGINFQGRGANDVYNNVIINPSDAGIWVQAYTNATDPVFDHAPIHFTNNTIINPGSYGIEMLNTDASEVTFRNNIVVLPGRNSTFTINDDKGLLQTGTKDYSKVDAAANWATDHNLFTASYEVPGFADYVGNDYRLTSASALAIDKGRDAGAHGVVSDFAGNARPQGGAYDIGAYEYMP